MRNEDKMDVRNSTRRAWLDYAWSIASAATTGDQHLAGCEAGGGAPPIPGLSSADCATRLPGFIGEAYEPAKGVLLVGVERGRGVELRRHAIIPLEMPGRT